MMNRKSKEPQYNVQFEALKAKGPVKLGPTASHIWRDDPRHLCFLLSRYKFCSKLLVGKRKVLEVGCGDAFGTRLVLQTVHRVHGLDFDPLFIKWAKEQYSKEGLNASFQVLDIIKNMPKGGPYDGIYAIDFIEHIRPKDENKAMKNICNAITTEAICIIGTPNSSAKKYASKYSAEGHINLKNAESLKKILCEHFSNVFLFSMNDEVVHTGFSPMAHYLFGVGCGKKK